MPVVVRGLTIAAPPAAVWRVLVDLPRQPTWMRDLKAITGLGPGPLAVGSRAMGHVRMFGLAQEDPIEITHLDAPRHYGVRHMGAFRGRGDVWLEVLPGGRATRVTWREELRPDAASLGLPAAMAPLLAVLEPLTGPLFQAVFRADLRRLRDVVISGR